MKFIVSIIAFIIGAYMIIDGIYVMMHHKYIGPSKPGPWAYLFQSVNIDVFKLGPLFIGFGLLWLIFLFAFNTNKSWSYRFGVLLSILTLWYLPIGTILSLIIMFILIKKFSSRHTTTNY